MSFTRGQFCKDLLVALGNILPTQNVINFMIGWSIEESGHDLSHMASYNLWNTTLPLPGSTVFNYANVQNYTSYAQGIQANAATIRNGLYPALLRALQTNDSFSLGVTGPMAGDVAGDLSVWVSGQREPIQTSYTSTIIAIARNPGNAANDTASGTGTPITFGPGGCPAFTLCPASDGTVPSCKTNCECVYCGNQSQIDKCKQVCDQNNGGVGVGVNTPSIISQLGAAGAWITNPTRVIKMIAGLLLIAGALVMLIAPDVLSVIPETAPIVAAAKAQPKP